MRESYRSVIVHVAVVSCLLNPVTFLPTAGCLLWRVCIKRRVRDQKPPRADAQLNAFEPSKDDRKLVWYFAFGSNMDPDTLGKIRKVYPTQSKACKVLGYTLTFAHSGLPYIEPGFGTIEPLALHPIPPTLKIATSHRDASAAASGKATMYSTPSAAVASALKAAVTAGDSTDASSPRPQAGNGSPAASPELPVSVGLASSQRFNRGRVSPGSDASSDNDFHPTNAHDSRAVTHVNNGNSNADQQGSGPDGVLVHGVVHQISQADMKQIIKTESGGGSGSHGYYVQTVQCELYRGGHVQALALLTHPNSKHHQAVPALPSQRYLNILQKGAKHSGLAQEYQDYLALLDYYQPVQRGQRIGAFFVSNLYGKPLRHLIWRVLPSLKNARAVFLFHLAFSWIVVSMWLLHDYIMEPVLGSGRHN